MSHRTDADDRALSTVLDVALCVLLIGGAVVTLTTVVPDTGHADETGGSAETARAVLASTARVSVQNTTVRGSLASLLADATVARGSPGRVPRYALNVSRVARRRLANTSRRANLTASWRPTRPCRNTTLAVGRAPPAGAAVDAVTLTIPSANATAQCGRAPIHLTVRTWSQ